MLGMVNCYACLPVCYLASASGQDESFPLQGCVTKYLICNVFVYQLLCADGSGCLQGGRDGEQSVAQHRGATALPPGQPTGCCTQQLAQPRALLPQLR
jgi:hypothetical protein